LDEMDKVKFLKQMGYGGSGLRSYLDKDKVQVVVAAIPKKEEMPKNHVDKTELINLHKLFNQKAGDS